MDFVKALLVYMTVTMALNLQAAPTPGVRPEATPALNVTVVGETENLTDELTAPIVGSIVATLGPLTPTPLPTITPNAAYGTLRMGDRGEEVRKLQTRLKELGYLQGNIDGAYGYQTRNAVMLFQRNNYLDADGAAGKSTLTRLYEDPDVIPNPAVITPTPAPTATPDAQGLIPIPEEPMGAWQEELKAKVMVNGEMLTVPDTNASPRVWKRGADVILSLTDLLSALSIKADTSWGNQLMFVWQDYQVEAYLTQEAKLERSEDAEGFIQAYDVAVDGRPVTVYQGQLMYQDGQWYALTDFLKTTLNAECRWDEEEKTLLIAVQEKALADAVD